MIGFAIFILSLIIFYLLMYKFYLTKYAIYLVEDSTGNIYEFMILKKDLINCTVSTKTGVLIVPTFYIMTLKRKI